MIPRKSAKTQHIVVMYTQKHLTMRQIAKLVGLTATAVCKRLKAAGITSKQGEWVAVECDFCGSQIQVMRGRWRKSERQYCSEECYHYVRRNPDYRPWRQGQSIARTIVAQLYDLKPHHVVHHKDGDSSNNNHMNLSVYASQSDHMKHHHGITPVKAIWDGADNQ